MSSAIDPERLASLPVPGISRVGALFHRRATWVLIDQGIASAGNFLTANLLIRNLPKAEWGVFAILLETVLYLNSLQSALVVYPMLIRGAKADSVSAGRLASASVLLTLGLLPILGTATALSVYTLDAVPIVFTAIAALLLWEIQETTRRALMSQLRFADAVWGDAVSYLGQATFIFVAAKLNMLSLNTAFLGMALTSALGIVIQAIQIRLKPVGLGQVRKIAMEYWILGRWVLLINAGGLITGVSYLWVLQASHGQEAVAIFGAIAAMFKLAHPVISSLATLIVPAVARTAAESGAQATRRVALRYFKLGAILLSPYFLLLGLAPETSLRLFYGTWTPYAAYGSLLSLFILNYTMKYTTDILSEWLMGLGCSRESFFTQVMNIVITLLIGLPMTWFMGVQGLILGGMFATAFAALSTVYYLRKVLGDV